jgi:hypothetical protein
MSNDPREFNDLARRASDLMADTADVPRLLQSRLGEQHELTVAAWRMVSSIEALARELRSFDASAEPVFHDPYQDSN